jgi:hypothetical protein
MARVQEGDTTRNAGRAQDLTGLQFLQKTGRVKDPTGSLGQVHHGADHGGLRFCVQRGVYEAGVAQLRDERFVGEIVPTTMGDFAVVFGQPQAAQAEDSLGGPRINIDFSEDDRTPMSLKWNIVVFDLALNVRLVEVEVTGDFFDSECSIRHSVGMRNARIV